LRKQASKRAHAYMHNTNVDLPRDRQAWHESATNVA
jgi:hypothetical protein